jgi:hypothetical protein
MLRAEWVNKCVLAASDRLAMKVAVISSPAATAKPIACRIRCGPCSGKFLKGWPLVKAICDCVHDRITFGCAHTGPTKTAWDACPYRATRRMPELTSPHYAAA